MKWMLQSLDQSYLQTGGDNGESTVETSETPKPFKILMFGYAVVAFAGLLPFYWRLRGLPSFKEPGHWLGLLGLIGVVCNIASNLAVGAVAQSTGDSLLAHRAFSIANAICATLYCMFWFVVLRSSCFRKFWKVIPVLGVSRMLLYASLWLGVLGFSYVTTLCLYSAVALGSGVYLIALLFCEKFGSVDRHWSHWFGALSFAVLAIGRSTLELISYATLFSR